MPLDGKIEQFTRAVPEGQEWRQVLLDAAQYIREHGWCQHEMRSDDGRVCVWGAISMAVRGVTFGYCDKEAASVDAFERVITGNLAVDDWNDLPRRTASEVIAALESAARQA